MIMVFHELCVNYVQDKQVRKRILETLAQFDYGVVCWNVEISGRYDLQKHKCNLDVDDSLLPLERPASKKPFTANSLSQLTRATFLIDDQSQIQSLTTMTDLVSSYDIVAVKPTTERMFQACCAHVDTDLITIDCSQRLPFLLKSTLLGQAIDRGVYFEISYSAALTDTVARRHMITNAQSLVRLCKGKNLVFSSAASDAMALRAPYDAANVATLFGLPIDQSRHLLSANARHVLLHSQMRAHTYRGAVAVEPVVKKRKLNE